MLLTAAKFIRRITAVILTVTSPVEINTSSIGALELGFRIAYCMNRSKTASAKISRSHRTFLHCYFVQFWSAVKGNMVWAQKFHFQASCMVEILKQPVSDWNGLGDVISSIWGCERMDWNKGRIDLWPREKRSGDRETETARKKKKIVMRSNRDRIREGMEREKLGVRSFYKYSPQSRSSLSSSQCLPPSHFQDAGMHFDPSTHWNWSSLHVPSEGWTCDVIHTAHQINGPKYTWSSCFYAFFVISDNLLEQNFILPFSN